MTKFWRIALAIAACILAVALVVYGALSPSKQSTASKVSSSPTDFLRARPCDYRVGGYWQLDCYWFHSQGGFRQAVAVFTPLEAQGETPLVYLPGGPGEGQQTSADSLLFWELWLDDLQLRRPFVVFDYRGLAPGKPSWDCANYTRISKDLLKKNLTPQQEAQQTQLILSDCLAEGEAYFQRTTRAGWEQFNSQANAANLTKLLRHLQFSQWDILAVSYGTRVALEAAHGEGVRRVVLDSPYLPERRGQSLANWVDAFAGLWRACAAGRLCEKPRDDLQARFWQAMHALKAKPLRINTESWEDGKQHTWLLNDYRFAYVVYNALYSSELQHDIAPAIEAVLTRDSKALQDLLGFYFNAVFTSQFNSMQFIATECNDNGFATTGANSSDPQAKPWLAYFRGLSQFDPCKQPYFERRAPSVKPVQNPVLIAAGDLDPITPAKDAARLHQQLPQSYLVKIAGSHADFFHSACGLALIRRFLASEDLPAANNLIANETACESPWL